VALRRAEALAPKDPLSRPFVASIITAPHSLGLSNLFSNIGVWEITLTTMIAEDDPCVSDKVTYVEPQPPLSCLSQPTALLDSLTPM